MSAHASIPIANLLRIAFYAGELVWRERDRKVHEIVDSSSAPDWVTIAYGSNVQMLRV